MAESCCGKDELRRELSVQTEKLKSLKQEYQKLLIENLQKDLIIRQKKSEENKEKFRSFENQLSKRCLEQLNVIGESQKEDSQFVFVVLLDLHNGDIEEIKKLTLSGRSKKGNTSGLSAAKKEVLEKVFIKRLNNIPHIDESRKNNLNKLIRNAIDKVNK